LRWCWAPSSCPSASSSHPGRANHRSQHWPEHWTAIELAVLAAETVGYALATRIGWRRGFVLAAVANVVTAALSVALM